MSLSTRHKIRWSYLSEAANSFHPDELPPRISLRATLAATEAPLKKADIVPWLRQQASETRRRADESESRGARWGLLQLAVAYDSQADEIEATIAQNKKRRAKQRSGILYMASFVEPTIEPVSL
jgi:hypothetical protein